MLAMYDLGTQNMETIHKLCNFEKTPMVRGTYEKPVRTRTMITLAFNEMLTLCLKNEAIRDSLKANIEDMKDIEVHDQWLDDIMDLGYNQKGKSNPIYSEHYASLDAFRHSD